MTKSTVTTKISAAFLATVLVAGIIALSSPSFMVGAQAAPGYGMEKEYGSYEQPEYGNDSYDKKLYEKEPKYGMDSYDKKSSYGSEPEYGMDSYDKKSSYGSEPEYGMDSYDKKPSYEKEPKYGTDSYDKKSYGNDDYKSQYSSYGKDNRDKSKDSVIVKKVKCNNINLNLNGISINATGGAGTNGGANGADGGAVEAASLSGNGGSNGYGDSNGYGERKQVDKKDGFTFVCINNNNNVVGGGNATDGNGNETDPCEDCFAQNLNATAFADVEEALAEGIDIVLGGDSVSVVPLPTVEISSFAELCALIDDNPRLIVTILQQVLEAAGLETLDAPTFFGIVECIADALGIPIVA